MTQPTDINLDYLEKPVDSDELQPWQRLDIVFHVWTKKNDEQQDLFDNN
jgi:hypothetical protein